MGGPAGRSRLRLPHASAAPLLHLRGLDRSQREGESGIVLRASIDGESTCIHGRRDAIFIVMAVLLTTLIMVIMALFMVLCTLMKQRSRWAG